MTEEREHLIEDLAAYVLGSLDDAERLRVDAHVASCATCAARLDEYRSTSSMLAIGLDPLAPPPEALAVIRSRVRGQRVRRGWVRLMPRLGGRAVWPVATALAAALLVWNVLLQWQFIHPRPGPEVEALARRPGRLVILSGTGIPGASARLFVAADEGHAHLAIAGLPSLPPERTYQLWFVRPGAAPVTGGTFVADRRGRAWATISVPVSLEHTHAIMITEEPAPGSAAPTGRLLLEAHAWR